MARIDGMLRLVVDQGANELRLGTDREPRMFSFGTPKRLSMPATDGAMLREMLGDLLTPAREAELRAHRQVDIDYDAAGVGHFHGKIVPRGDGGIDVVLIKGPAKRAAAEQAPAQPTPIRTPPTAPTPSTSPVVDARPVERTAPPPQPNEAHAIEAPMPTTTFATPMLAELIARASQRRASDLHLTEGETPCVRIDGRLVRLEDEPPTSIDRVFSLSAATVARVASGESLDLGLDVPGAGRARAHVYATTDGLAAAVRLLPPDAPTLASLELPIPIDDLVDLPHGLVLVCGASGSGKSTTLAALAQHALQRRSIVLVTLEDPIEYRLNVGRASILRRRQVGRDVPAFARGLRDALREDLDVLLVGELRDAETIQLALTAAETGHLVLASLHSRSAVSAVARIVDAYPAAQQHQARSQLADVLRAVVAQRLLPRARAAGGGRVPCVEVLRVTAAAASLIREGKPEQLATVIQSGRREQMIDLERCLAEQVKAGKVDAAVAMAAANDASSLAMLLGRSVPIAPEPPRR